MLLGGAQFPPLKRARMSAMRATLVPITPTPKEAALFNVLSAAIDRAGNGTTVRVAGGWVRDKLLGLASDDIDLAVDNCTGVAFAETIRAQLEATDSSGQNFKVAVIKANPDQSKHLETATIRVGGFEIDITNLRSSS